MVGTPRAVVLSSQNVPLFVRHVRERGGDADAIIRRFELGPAVEEATEARLRLRELHAFGDACAEAVNDPAFGIATAAWAPRGSFGLVEFACRSAATFGDALERLVRFYALFSDPARVRLEAGQGQRSLSFELESSRLCWGRHLNECCLALFCRIAREASGGVCLPLRVWFAHPEPKVSESVYSGLGCSDVRFGSGRNGIAFPCELLDVPLLSADRALLRALEEAVTPGLAAASMAGDFLSTLRARVQGRSARGGDGGAPGVKKRGNCRRLGRGLFKAGEGAQKGEVSKRRT